MDVLASLKATKLKLTTYSFNFHSQIISQPKTIASIQNLHSKLPPKMANTTPTRRQVLTLLCSLLRTARNFPDYNIREYMKRRTIDGFRHNRMVNDDVLLSEMFSDGVSQLELARRQADVYSLFQPKLLMNILEIEEKNKRTMRKVRIDDEVD